MLDEKDEEYQKRKERARQLRNSVGMITANDMQNIGTDNITTINNDNSYIEKLNRAKQLRNSVGFITSNDQMIDEQQNNPIMQNTIDQSVEANGIDLSKYPDLEPGDSVEKTVISLNNKEIEGVPQYEESEESKERKERYNVIAKGGKLESLKTEQDKQEEEAIKYNKQQANSDKNLFSQFGKMIENFWLGITSGTKEIVKETTQTSYNNKQENELLAGSNPNVPDIVKEEYKYQINENDLLKQKMNQKVNATSLFKINTNTLTQQPLLKGDTAQSIDNELNQYKDAFGDLELNPVTRNLSKSIAQDQNKIATNVNEIDNPIIKKVSELAPSAGNSLAGAGISMVNPYLGMSYFMISAMGSYEDDGRRRGMSKQEAESYGKIMGFMEGATEMIGIDKFLSAGNAVRKGSFKEALRNYGLDMVDNAIQEAVIDPIDELMAGQIAGNEYQKNNYSTMKGYIELLGEMIRDGVDGALSSLLMNGIGLSIDSSVYLYNKIQNNKKITETDVKNAYTDIQNNPNIDVSEAFKSSFDYEKQKLQENNREIYRFLEFDNEGNIVAVKEAIGEKISLKNKQLNIEPIIVNVDGYYNVIDNQSGLKLDTTMYNSVQEAKVGFNEQIKNASQSTINEINQKVNKSKLAIINKMQEMTEDKAAQNMNNITNKFINQQSKQIVQPSKVFSTEETKNILSNNNVDTTQIKNRPYLGQEINDIIQTTTEQNKGNLNIEPTNYIANNQADLKMEDRTLQNVSSKKIKPYQEEHPELATEIQEMAWNFQEDLANSIEGKRYKVGDEWTGQKRSTTKELAEIKDETGASWDKINQALEDIANNKGDYALAKKIELVLDRALTEGYRNIYGKTIFPNERYLDKKSKIEGKDYKNTEQDYDASQYMSDEELRPFGEKKNKKGQLDVEGNQVENINKKYKNVSQDLIANIDTVLNGVIDRNRNIKVLDYTPKVLQKVGLNNLPIIMTQDHIRSTILTLDEAIKKGLNVKNKNFHGLGKETLLKVIDNIDKPIAIYQWQETSKNKYGKDDFIIITQFKDKNNDRIIVPVLANRKDNNYITVNKIKSTYGKIGLDEYLKKHIQDGSLNQIYNIKESDNSSGGIQYSSERKSNSNINNSIPQKKQNVKNETAINKKSMQKEQNNTSNDDIRSMKKPSLRVEYDSQGRQLSRQQQGFFKDSKVRDAKGNLMVMYHGTPNGDYTVFKAGSYFTARKEYADGYQNTWASAISSKQDASNPKTYETYLNITNPFTLQDSKAKDIYLNEFIKGGNSLSYDPYTNWTNEINQLDEIDWTEGEDLIEWLKENHPEYDGLILDEGGDGGYGEAEYSWRGKSFVPFNPNQIKNVDNVNPTSNDDIRYMKKNNSNSETENKINTIKIDSNGDAKYIDENRKEYDIYFRFDAKGGFKGKEHRSGDSMWENQIDELIDEKQESYYDEEKEDYIEKNPLLEEYGVTQEEYDDMSYEKCLKIKMKIADDYLQSYPESPDVFPLSSGASSIKLSKDGIDVLGDNISALLYEYSTSDDDIVTFYTGNLQNDIGIWNEPIVKPDRVIYTGNSKEIIEILEDVTPNKEKIKKIARIINNQDTSNDDILYMKKPSQKVEYDNQGRQLSKQQQKFFKDSKVRDEKR